MACIASDPEAWYDGKGDFGAEKFFQIVRKISRHRESVCYFCVMATRSHNQSRLTESASAGCHNQQNAHNEKHDERDSL